MNENLEKLNPHLMQLVLSLQAGAMQQMGKIVSQITGKVERDLLLAKTTIDILEMFEQKTKGNLTEEEKKLLSHVLYELRINYVEESKKPETDETETPSDTEKKTEENYDSENKE